MADDQQLSTQDIKDLQDIAGKLPTGHPMQGKINLLLNSQPTQFEKDRSGGSGFLGTVLGSATNALNAAMKSDPMGGRSMLDPKAWYNPDEAKFSPSTGALAHQAMRPIPADTPGGTIGRGAYRAATTLSPLIPGMNPEASEAAASKGDTGGVAAESAIPMGLTAAGMIAPKVTGSVVRGAARTALLDPVTGEPTVSPTSIAKRFLRTPEEVGDAKVAKTAAQMQEIESARQKELADIEKLRTMHGDDLMGRQAMQDATDAAHEAKLKDIETSRQKELADSERLKNQDAQSRMLRGRQQDALDANFTKQGRAVPLSRGPYATQQAADLAARQPVSINESPYYTQNKALAAQDMADRQPVSLSNSPYATQHAASADFAAGKPGAFNPISQGPEWGAAKDAFSPARSGSDVPQDPFSPSPTGTNGQDIISRTRRLVVPGQDPTIADIKRAGDLTQAPVQRLKTLAQFGDKLAQIELNRRLKND